MNRNEHIIKIITLSLSHYIPAMFHDFAKLLELCANTEVAGSLYLTLQKNTEAITHCGFTVKAYTCQQL